MNYLYGDSTKSQLKANFLEFLRDALDFCVFVLQADAKIKEGRVKIRVLGEEADAESDRLDRFITSVSRAVHGGDKGAPDSPTAQCGARLATMIVDAHGTTVDGIRKALADAIAKIEAEDAASREACVDALGALLAPHDPPGSSHVIQVVLGQSGRYSARLDAKGEPALAWSLEMAIPDGHAWDSPMKVERLAPHLEIRAPQLAGWITKEVKIKPQKIDRHVVAEVIVDGDVVSFEVRMETSPDAGFDFEVAPAKGSVKKAVRVGPADDASVGTFEPQAEDVPALVDLAKKLRASLDGIERSPAITAMFEESEFRTLPSFVDFVERLVAMMAPIVGEIARRSLTPNELVLRRALANDRREEIFIAKATLREKLAVLPDAVRALFTPLGLDVAEKAKPSAVTSDRPPVRSELPPKAPPAPKPRSIPPPALRSAPPPPSVGSGGRTIQPPQGAPPPAPHVTPANPPSPVPAVRKPLSDSPQLEVGEEIEMSSDALEIAPESSPNLLANAGNGERNEALVAALKKIMTLSRNGRALEAYQEYASLFSSTAFADYQPDDQRQALKLMILAKTHPTTPEAVATAHRAALSRLKALAETGADASDHELLGVAHLALGDEKAASAAFQAGLELERAKNPQSELIATLMRRVSQL